MREIKVRRALVTGASSGLGRQLALLLAQQKIDLILSGRNEERLNAVAAECQKQVDVHRVVGDLVHPSTRALLLDAIVLFAPDLVINNAGMGIYGPALAIPVNEQKTILQLNGEVAMELSIEAARVLIANGQKGVIANISSVTAFFPFPQYAMYAASKAFINSFSLAFDCEVKEYGVRVLTLCPGQIATPFRTVAGNGVKQEHSTASMSIESAAKHILRQVKKRKMVDVFDWRYKIVSVLLKWQWIWRLAQPFLQRSIDRRHNRKELIFPKDRRS
ncbi:SDR family NAD(P)-dependent oxidoreductase [Simkania negevensis]|uniref:SDR family NAD(P)-dependent oxidoreductase n=1 Tax=Simkania negevensis TaxID=83561 RepID=A0ABS3AR19_9BACT|nr:SDR family NAD(P)-dependent oxidoreductase [Simkania negevensis]